jgi:hypothetical protein
LARERKKRTDHSILFHDFLFALFLGSELVLANAAELTGEIFGQVFPLRSSLVLVIDPATNIANILHWSSSFAFF